MIKIFFTTLFFGLVACSNAQVKSENQRSTSVTKSFELDPTRVYNFHTGKKIPADQFMEMVNGKPFSIQREIDSYGRVSKFLYDTTGNSGPREVREKMEVGEPFPPFNMWTVAMKKIRFNELRGKYIIVRFELFADSYDFKNNRLVNLENQMRALGQENVVGFMFFRGMQVQLESLDKQGSLFNLFVQGSNFHDRYGIIRTPITVVIDREGIVMRIFRGSDEIDLSFLD
ncbi:hypothetical protein [Ekhidna sp.]|uniref:peroxiredoxin family protein n=1 Tax=Ekhidna sp. TaxID=2608089 RepID=UPI003296A533